jgi:hypothetical protein
MSVRHRLQHTAPPQRRRPRPAGATHSCAPTGIHDGVTESAFVAMRSARDSSLAAPALLLPSIQVNIRAGRLPRAESNGVRYLKIPVKLDAAVTADA